MKCYATIHYFSVKGYDENGFADYRVLRWKCESEEEFQYALEVLNEDDIFDIKIWED